jgi:hypothetical protein
VVTGGLGCGRGGVVMRVVLLLLLLVLVLVLGWRLGAADRVGERAAGWGRQSGGVAGSCGAMGRLAVGWGRPSGGVARAALNHRLQAGTPWRGARDF